MHKRHCVVCHAVIQEDGSVAWQASSEVRSRFDVVALPTTCADEGCRDEANCAEAGLWCVINKDIDGRAKAGSECIFRGDAVVGVMKVHSDPGSLLKPLAR